MAILKSKEAERAAQLDPIAAKVARGAAKLKPMSDSTPEEARALRESIGNPFAPPPVPTVATEDRSVSLPSGDIGIRLYRAQGESNAPQPALVFYHGGGFVLSNVEQYDTVVQQLCHHSGCTVVSVDYTLAPTHKLKSIHQQGFEAYQWIRGHAEELRIDPAKLAMGGDSAGGNLTIAVLLECKRQNYPLPVFQLLMYPSTDPSMSFPSIDEFSEGYFLTKSNMEWFRGHYLGTEEENDASLDFVNSDLVGLPPAYLMTAGFDPLRDEGKAFADKLEAQGVKVEHVCYTDMIHGFLSFAGGLEAGMECLQDMGIRTKRALLG
ncbi:MAG: alpha/beta hydrolase [Pseudohongiellaceae bacterium]